jgi:predicted O-methyltransferase YrrM
VEEEAVDDLYIRIGQASSFFVAYRTQNNTMTTTIAATTGNHGDGDGQLHGQGGERRYEFDADLFSTNIPLLSAVLVPLAGTPLRMLEIGCHQGRSAVWMLENVLTHPESRMTCVDPFIDIADGTSSSPGTRELFTRNVIGNFPDKVELHVGYSSRVLKSPPLMAQQFDIIYVDGDHHAVNVLEDAVLAFRLLRVNGIMIFDDYLGGGIDMFGDCNALTAINAFMNFYGAYLRVVAVGYQLVVFKTAEGRP